MKDKLTLIDLQVQEEVIPALGEPPLSGIKIVRTKLLGTGGQGTIHEANLLGSKKRYADKYVKI